MQRDLLPPVMPSITRSAGGRDWIYTPVGTPQNSWRPTVTSVTANSNGSFHLSGTRLTGFVSVGEDDYQDPQNFPIVYLKDRRATCTTPARSTSARWRPAHPARRSPRLHAAIHLLIPGGGPERDPLRTAAQPPWAGFPCGILSSIVD